MRHMYSYIYIYRERLYAKLQDFTGPLANLDKSLQGFTQVAHVTRVHCNSPQIPIIAQDLT